MLLKQPSAAYLENSIAGALVASLLVLAAPLRAQVVVERVGSEAAAGVVEGDVLVGWETVGTEPTHSGTFQIWSDAELLDVEVTPLGPLRIRLRRDGEPLSVELPPRELQIDARPSLTIDAMTGVAEILADPTAEGAESAMRSAVTGASADVESWALTRLAEARAEAGNRSGAAKAYRAAAGAQGGRLAGELLRRAGEEEILGTDDLEKAEAAYRQALAVWEQHEPGGLGSSTVLASLGSLQVRRHDFDDARRTLARARAIQEELAPASWLLADSINSQGILHGRAGDLGLAEARFLEALEIRRRLGDEGSRMLANLGIVARLRGDLERARSYQEQALEAYHREDTLGLSRHWNNLGHILCELGELGPAAEAHTEALELLETMDPGSPARANVLFHRGKCHTLRGDLEGAQTDLARARRILGFDEPRTPLQSLLVLQEGEVAYLRGDLDLAVDQLTRGLEVQTKLRPDSLFEALGAAALARAYAARGDREEADALFRRAIRALERQQARIGGGDRGLVAFRTKHAAIYREYGMLLLESGRPDAAFELYERSRAHGLRALLSGREIDWATGRLAGLAPDRHRLSQGIETLYGELASLDPEAEAERRELRERIEKLHAERDELSARMYEASPRARRFEVPPAMDLAMIRAELPKGILALAYSVGEDATTLFVLEAGRDLEVYEVPVTRDALSRDVERWGRLVTRPRPRAGLRVQSERLGRLLLGPVTDRIRGAPTILVIPDGALHSLPFAALPVPDAGRHLVELAPVERAASVSVYLSEAGDRPAAVPERVVVLGDPATPAEAVARYRRGLSRLPAARLEAEAVRREFGERSRILLGEEATEEAARRELPGSDLVHFACHAVVDEVLPMDSALVLTPSGEMSGLLHAWEIVEDLELQADLVVLSACQTARGGQRAGEGIVGLVRSLQIAGARNVLATLWNVEDESTAVLMERFYGYLAAGDPPAAALRRAQMDLIRGPVETVRDGRTVSLRLDSHRYWAPFVLLGVAR